MVRTACFRKATRRSPATSSTTANGKSSQEVKGVRTATNLCDYKRAPLYRLYMNNGCAKSTAFPHATCQGQQAGAQTWLAPAAARGQTLKTATRGSTPPTVRASRQTASAQISQHSQRLAQPAASTETQTPGLRSGRPSTVRYRHPNRH
jgi:hypothetical protein